MLAFDFRSRALGLHATNLAMALDPGIVVIGGGLMDPEAASVEFRERYLRIVRKTAAAYLWPVQRKQMRIVPAMLGDLSQAIAAALVTFYQGRAYFYRAELFLPGFVRGVGSRRRPVEQFFDF
jgi:predicted NBD/HSP70 family sugar kinase